MTEIEYEPGTLMRSRERQTLVCKCGKQADREALFQYDWFNGKKEREEYAQRYSCGHKCQHPENISVVLFAVYPTPWSEYK